MLKVLVIDGQGGGIGRNIIETLRIKSAKVKITAVGTNSVATANMQKAGADFSATGENAVAVNAAKADVITGPIGMVISNALLGEVTPAIAAALSASDALKILVPLNKCNIIVAGVSDKTLSQNIEEAAARICRLAEEKDANSDR